MLSNNSKGFTLLEIIIAIGLLAVMTVSMSEVTSGVMMSRKRSQDRNNSRQAVTIGLSKMMNDLRTAFQADTKFYGVDKYYKTGFVGKVDSINFSTMGNVHYVKNKKDTPQVQVGYSLVKNEQGYFDLIRRQTDFLTDDLEKGGQSFILMNNVKEFVVEYYDSNKKEWQDNWDTESSSSLGRLPQTVKVKITVLGEIIDEDTENRRERYYELFIPIPMYANKISF